MYNYDKLQVLARNSTFYFGQLILVDPQFVLYGGVYMKRYIKTPCKYFYSVVECRVQHLCLFHDNITELANQSIREPMHHPQHAQNNINHNAGPPFIGVASKVRVSKGKGGESGRP
jgi:hypothetical protein